MGISGGHVPFVPFPTPLKALQSLYRRPSVFKKFLSSMREEPIIEAQHNAQYATVIGLIRAVVLSRHEEAKTVTSLISRYVSLISVLF